MTIKNKFLALLLPAFFISSTVTFALGFGTLGGQPAGQPYSSEDRSWFIYELEPGESKEDALEILNTGDEEVLVSIYPADFSPSSDGGFALKQRVEEMTGVGSWIKLESEEILVPPKERVLLPFTINVPEANLDVGEHAGGILIERKSDKSEEKQGGVVLSTRVGIRVYVTIPGEIIKKLSFHSFEPSITKKIEYFLFGKNIYFIDIPKTYDLRVNYSNDGNVSSDVMVDYEIKDSLFNKPVEEYTSKQKVSRDTKTVSHMEWKAPRYGRYVVSASAYLSDSGEAAFTIPESVIWIVPWDIVAGITLILIALIIVILMRKHNRSSKGWKPYKVKKGDEITKLAQKADIPWKKLALVNRLKAPYILTAGQTIMLPPGTKIVDSTKPRSRTTKAKKTAKK